ncbi:hypothetical protein K469DRAFT_694255 [Zopfia rhizophila CBS 207.26]|uniref:Carbohydrate-binding module family 18 protein n=1 Tax=Zopfia rhizophila CBS 207.26 TaxID=1314779 RepID=A0A6A6EPT5_9PEZI|nr:hypothetical protein K469DRAFT_694255 [Zopfia rhizophila CBS 207.26]
MLPLLPLLSLIPFLLSLTHASDPEPIQGHINPIGQSDAHPFVKRACPGAPYSNTFCCGALHYCFTGEVCCSSYYCCPGGTTCLGGLMCSPGGRFSETGNAATTVAPPRVTSAVDVTVYETFYYTITWFYYTYFYTYDFALSTTILQSYTRTTYSYFTITATDSAAASAIFASISSTASFSAPASETAPTPLPSLTLPSIAAPTTVGGNLSLPTTTGPAQFTGGAGRMGGMTGICVGRGVWGVVVLGIGLPGFLMIVFLRS